ncbi:MAG: LysE family transporter [Candidatus Thiodiazotropha sp. L084R]
MLSTISAGIVLGLSAGLAPGPLLTLVISETLQHDIRAGIKVAVAPIITDLPIIIFSLFIINEISGLYSILGLISLLGGCFVFYIGYENVRSAGIDLNIQRERSNSLKKGVIVNALSPHPYLFWFSVGSPMIIKMMNTDGVASFVFILSFYSLLVGSKIVLAVVVGKYKSFLNGVIYIYTIRTLGLILWILSVVLLYDGLKLMGFV